MRDTLCGVSRIWCCVGGVLELAASTTVLSISPLNIENDAQGLGFYQYVNQNLMRSKQTESMAEIGFRSTQLIDKASETW